MKKLVIGILAHVDAGKTTLSESILYLSGSIRKLGRVDHGDAFLDTYELERERGITIFSKQAEVTLGDMEVTLLDTPGHVDFSAEMERTLQVLDYAILVINGADGVQGHTQTLWRLLARYQIPVFLFVNKMDQSGTHKQQLLSELNRRLDERCQDFTEGQEPGVFHENLAMCDEELLETYLEDGIIGETQIRKMISSRRIFPCYFGSALKVTGVQKFLEGLSQYTEMTLRQEAFGAKVYKIARDDQESRLTYMKITGGSLKVKTLLSNRAFTQEETEGEQNSQTDGEASIWEEKVDQIRIYSGSHYEMVNEVTAGTVCAVTGLSKTFPGEGLGTERASEEPLLEPVLTYQIKLPSGQDIHGMLRKLWELEEEDPQLRIVWDEQLKEIHAQLMGEVQIEILRSLIQERFGIMVEFGPGNIVYKETIQEPVEGVGHFEPLRHYAEVHLLLEPQERGSGLEFASACSEDVLERNWQKLILTHLEEKIHRGVLTGSPITDMKMTLIAGKAHLKHTEGGDFREATYRAVRQGLKRATSILLEPYYEFCIEVPSEMVGRAMSDIQKMYGSFSTPALEGDFSILTGCAPVATMQDYQKELISYTKGRGRLSLQLKGYEPCHNEEEVVDRLGYDAERDLENPTGSVFCSHGAGFTVRWDQVWDYMHIEAGNWPKETDKEPETDVTAEPAEPSKVQPVRAEFMGSWSEDKELEEIFIRTYGSIGRARGFSQEPTGRKSFDSKTNTETQQELLDEYLLVDGYNIIFAWEELRALAEANIDGARNRLMDILCNFQGFKRCIVILVFDAYKVEGNPGEILKYHNIHVVYTKEAVTADQYIERTVHEMGRKYHVTVATSDHLEQVIIRGQGGYLLSATDLKAEIDLVNELIRSEYLEKRQNNRNYLFNHMTEEMADYMEEVRLGLREMK